MMYFKGNNFYPFAIDWQEQAQGKMIVPGLGIYFMSPREKDWNLDNITREMFFTRSMGMGHAYFRSKFFTDNLKGIYDAALNEIDRQPALVPAMTWVNVEKPHQPTLIMVEKNRIEWQKQNNTTYNLYSSRTWPVDISKAENLMLYRQEISSIEIPDDPSHYYALTAMDRYGNESDVVQCQNQPKANQSSLIPNDGNRAILPNWINECDGIVMLCDINGTPIKRLQQTGNAVNIKQVTDGFYQLRSLNANGISHRLGFILVKRF